MITRPLAIVTLAAQLTSADVSNPAHDDIQQEYWEAHSWEANGRHEKGAEIYASQAAWDKDCKRSKQSPINIDSESAEVATFPDYLRTPKLLGEISGMDLKVKLDLANGNHAILIDLVEPINHKVLMCRQIQFLVGKSEHTVNGLHTFGELRLLCFQKYKHPSYSAAMESTDPRGIATFTFLVEEFEGVADADFFKQIVSAFTYDNSELAYTTKLPTGSVDLHDYFRYVGSLSLPPCSEVVDWTIFTDTIKISPTMAQSLLHEAKLAFGESSMGKVRAIQKLNKRDVVHYTKSNVDELFMGYYKAIGVVGVALFIIYLIVTSLVPAKKQPKKKRQ